MSQGENIVKRALKHAGEEYVLETSVPLDDPDWTGPWNCSMFASWNVYQETKIIYGCENDKKPRNAYSGYWARDAKNKGKIITIAQAAVIPGAVVVRLPASKQCGHVVISQGKNWRTIEAASSRTGVIESTLHNRRWDIGVLVPGVDYGTMGVDPSPPDPPTVVIYRLKSPYMRDTVVLEIQKALNKHGFQTDEDMIYGPGTYSSVFAFQQKHGLVPDGEVGPETAKELGIELPSRR